MVAAIYAAHRVRGDDCQSEIALGDEPLRRVTAPYGWEIRGEQSVGDDRRRRDLARDPERGERGDECRFCDPDATGCGHEAREERRRRVDEDDLAEAQAGAVRVQATEQAR